MNENNDAAELNEIYKNLKKTSTATTNITNNNNNNTPDLTDCVHGAL